MVVAIIFGCYSCRHLAYTAATALDVIAFAALKFSIDNATVIVAFLALPLPFLLVTG